MPQRRSEPSTWLRAIATCLLWLPCALLVSGIALDARADDDVDVAPSGDFEPLFSWQSPLGAIEYRAARGLQVPAIGLNIGGFTTIEFVDEKGEQSELALDNVNFLVLLEPTSRLRAFVEIELDGIATWRTSKEKIDTDFSSSVERLFGDVIVSDALALRVGKFQTPFGRWNLVPAEPFVWTPEEPVALETALDEHQTGAAVLGTLYPGGGALHWWLYGQFMGPLDKSEDPEPGDKSVGGRLAYDLPSGDLSFGASFLVAHGRDRSPHPSGPETRPR